MFVIKVAKILIIFLNFVLLSNEFKSVLNIIVLLLSFMKVISFPDLNRFIKTIKLIVNFLNNQWKNCYYPLEYLDI